MKYENALYVPLHYRASAIIKETIAQKEVFLNNSRKKQKNSKRVYLTNIETHTHAMIMSCESEATPM